MTIKFSDITGGGIPYGNNSGRPANPGIGKLYSNGEAQRLELYTAAGWTNIVQETPGVSSISGTYSESTDSGVIIITGTNFATGCYATAIGTNGIQVDATSSTFNSIVQVTATFNGLSNAYEPYDIKVTNPSNLFGIIPDALYINASPVWQTNSGSLGTFNELVSVSVSATATDSDSTITYSLANGSSLPSGVTLNSSSGLISGTLPAISSDTTYNFTINASDGTNIIPRAFSITSQNLVNWSTPAGSLGTFTELNSISVTVSATTPDSQTVTYSLAQGSSLPSGISLNSSTGVISGTLPNITENTTYTFTINATNNATVNPRQFSILSQALLEIEYLMVAGGGGGGGGWQGGGGGAGGLLTGTMSIVPSSFAISIGTAGQGASETSTGTNGGDTTAFSLTAVGGGRGVGEQQEMTIATSPVYGSSGGSGGGTGHPVYGSAYAGTPGQGYAGGTNWGGCCSNAGGGGAGGVGVNAPSNGNAGNGGPGVSSSITGQSLFYAGGGGGGNRTSGTRASGGSGVGGQGGNADAGGNAVANTGSGGGGGGGASNGHGLGGNGSNGVLIIAYPNTRPAITTIPGTLTYDQPSRSGYRVYRFTAGSGTITF